MILDTIPHIIDTTRQVINVVMPEKSFIESAVLWIGISLNVITILVFSFWNYRQIKNSHLLVDKNSQVNLKNTLINTKITNELKLIDEFRIIRDQIVGKMNQVGIYRFSSGAGGKKTIILGEILHLNELSKNKLKRVTKWESLDLDSSITEFTSLISSEKPPEDMLKEFNKISEIQNRFMTLSSKIIDQETDKIYKMD